MSDLRTALADQGRIIDAELARLRAEVARLTAALAQAREENGTLSRTVERLTQALNTLQSAARTFVASSDQLRAAQNVASPSALTLDSEREMNAILTAEVARLTAALAQAHATIERMAVDAEAHHVRLAQAEGANMIPEPPPELNGMEVAAWDSGYERGRREK